MAKARAGRGGAPPPETARYEYCLYLLTEAEQIIYRSAASWPEPGSRLVGTRLTQVLQTLRRATEKPHQ